VYYHEPDWAYKKYLMTEVEIGNYTTLITSLVGLSAIQEFLTGVHSGNSRLIRSNTWKLVFYMIFGCIINLVHYLAERPSNYGAMANFTIAGRGLACIPFTILIVQAWFTTPVQKISKSDRKGEIGVPLLDGEEEASGRVTRSSSGRGLGQGQGQGARRRSRTPVKA
jgi:hypothetical protein